ncbi:extracellular solute-binding protein [Paenibacillaceae bacterium]|nr:extracellular solute-binding protein [Paenibacillaceae bacterium]
MSRTKLILSVVIMLACIVNLAACGNSSNIKVASDPPQQSDPSGNDANNNNKDKDKDKDKGKKVKLTFQIHYSDETSPQHLAMKKLVNDYTAAHANIEIEVDALNMEQQKLKLKTQAATNDMPDITVVNPGAQMKPFVDGKKLAPLNDILDKDGLRETFVSGVLDYYTFDDNVYGLSEGNDIAVIYYNKELFEQADVAIPTTYEEMVESAKKLRAVGITPMVIGEKETWTGSFFFMNIVLRLAGPGFLEDVMEKNKTFNDPVFVRAIEKMQDFIQAGGFQEGATSMDYNTAENLFVTGKAAMYFMGSWAVGTMENSDIKDKIGIFKFPTVDGKGSPDEYMLAPGLGYCIAAGSKHIEEAKAFLHYYMTNYPKVMFELKSAVGIAQLVDGDFTAAGYSQAAMEVLDLFKTVKGGDIAFDNTIDPSTTQVHLNSLQNLFVSDIAASELAQEHQNAFQANNP